MICNRVDLDAAIDWLTEQGIPTIGGLSNALEIRQYRGRCIWRPRGYDWFLLDWSLFTVAPWVVDDSW
jgi:hypothetical protein